MEGRRRAVKSVSRKWRSMVGVRHRFPAHAGPYETGRVVAVNHNARMKMSVLSRKSGSRLVVAPNRVGLAPALVAGVLWLLAALGAGYWVLRIWGQSPVTPVAAVAPPAVPGDSGAVARALGSAPPAMAAAAPVPTPAAARYQLLGVVDQSGRAGAALIAFDGQPPRPYAVGATLDGGLVLQSVDRLGARLGDSLGGPTAVTLEMPQPPAASN